MSSRAGQHRTTHWWTKIAIAEFIFLGIVLLIFSIIDYSVGLSYGDSFEFRKAYYLWLAIFILPIHWLVVKKWRNQDDTIKNNPSIFRKTNVKNRFWSHIFFTRGILFVIVALAQPSTGRERMNGSIKSLELMVCLDVSNSMNVTDMNGKESRLTSAKRAINELINHLSGEKIGVTVFAGASLVQLPLTADYEAAKLFTEEISTGLIRMQGTNISNALETSEKMFSPIRNGKAILLITDGEDHDGNALEKAAGIKKNGVSLHILGLGSKSGGPLYMDPKRPELGLRKSENGDLIISKMNPLMISKLAEACNGSYLLSSSDFPTIDPLLTEINQLERTNLRDLAFVARTNNYRTPLFVAIVCFLVYFGLSYAQNLKLKK